MLYCTNATDKKTMGLVKNGWIVLEKSSMLSRPLTPVDWWRFLLSSFALCWPHRIDTIDIDLASAIYTYVRTCVWRWQTGKSAVSHTDNGPLRCDDLFWTVFVIILPNDREDTNRAIHLLDRVSSIHLSIGNLHLFDGFGTTHYPLACFEFTTI